MLPLGAFWADRADAGHYVRANEHHAEAGTGLRRAGTSRSLLPATWWTAGVPGHLDLVPGALRAQLAGRQDQALPSGPSAPSRGGSPRAVNP